jgi:hypothetical protein
MDRDLHCSRFRYCGSQQPMDCDCQTSFVNIVLRQPKPSRCKPLSIPGPVLRVARSLTQCAFLLVVILTSVISSFHTLTVWDSTPTTGSSGHPLVS